VSMSMPTGVLLVNLDQAAAMLALSRRSLQSLVYRGHLRSVHIGRSRRIALADLEAYVQGLRREQQPAELVIVGGGRQ